MSTISKIRKYIILAISGAVIIGIGTFLLLNSYMEKVEIIVAKTDLPSEHEIKEGDISYIQYFKGSVPHGYFDKKDDVIGRKLTCERKAGDPITESVFKGNVQVNMVKNLKDGEVLMALDVPYTEPLIEELDIGRHISIVSTEKEKLYSFNTGANNSATYESNEHENHSYSNNYADVVFIDGQVVIKGLEIVDIRIPEIKDDNLLTGSGKDNPYLFIKCSMNEAALISRITKEDKYKIFLEKY
jgi:hypothetical protein